jgi:Eco29kI restriction endonuclease
MLYPDALVQSSRRRVVESPKPDSGADREPYRLVGIAEIAELAGSSRQAIANLRTRDESFPAPLAELRSGPVFRETDIRIYLASRGRLPSAELDDSQISEPERFDPLTRLNLARSVERALLDQPLHPLPPSSPFGGGGVYCIYYSGNYEPYAGIVSEPPTIPVYAGRSTIHSRAIEGLFTPTDRPLLFNRLREHARTLEQAENLQLDDFSCRSLVVDDMWTSLAEALVIEHFRPLWNMIVDGFGNRDPGGGRYAQARSSWDELHPGRSWAARLQPSRRTRTEILQAVEDHLRAFRSPDLTADPRDAAQAQWRL